MSRPAPTPSLTPRISRYFHDGKSGYTIEQTPAGPFAYCNYDCDWDEAEGFVVAQCKRCAKVQKALKEGVQP